MGSAKLRAMRATALHAGLFVISAVLFALSFPSAVHDHGFGWLAFFALGPFFYAVNRIRWWSTPLWGAFFGFISYVLLNYWLANFHPLAILIVPVIYAAYFLVLVPVLRIMKEAFPRWGFLPQLVVWIAYEYMRTLGYLGYSYGIIGYSQYQLPVIVRLSALTGVWGVSALVVFPSILIAWMISSYKDRKKASVTAIIASFRIPLIGYAVVALVSVAVGMLLYTDLRQSPTVTMALIQQNIDPWVGGHRAYRRSLDILERESEAALAANPDIEMVVWSETSFVPSVDFHRRTRTQLDSWELVQRLLQFMEGQDIPYVIGNGDRQQRRRADGSLGVYDYNAVLLMQDGDIAQTYRKTHLVPFTEHFPYERQLPWLHRLLVEHGTTFWAEGSEYTVFEAAGIHFSTPICFEDTFGYITRRFVQQGAEVLVNLTNDSWADSVASAMQHLGMAVFRSAETRRSMVRSTNGGMTAMIDPNGRIVDVLPPFVTGHLIVDVPVYTESDTLYTAIGDWLAIFCSVAVLLLLVFVAACKIIQLTDYAKQGHNE